MNRVWHLFLISVLLSLFFIVGSFLYQEHVLAADFEAVRYGFPFPWLERVLCTFKGRTDYYLFEPINMVINTVLYFLLSLGISASFFLISKQKQVRASFSEG